MFGAKSKLIQKLYAEIQRLRELLARIEGERDEARSNAQQMRDLAARGVEITNDQQEAIRRLRGTLSVENGKITIRTDPSSYFPNYQAPEAKNCPECNVSVRSEAWPAECPACHVTFGFPES